MRSLSPCSFSPSHSGQKCSHIQTKQRTEREKKKKKNPRRQVVRMSKSIKNDAYIMLLISQHFNTVSVTESDTVFRVTSKERTTQA